MFFFCQKILQNQKIYSKLKLGRDKIGDGSMSLINKTQNRPPSQSNNSYGFFLNISLSLMECVIIGILM